MRSITRLMCPHLQVSSWDTCAGTAQSDAITRQATQFTDTATAAPATSGVTAELAGASTTKRGRAGLKPGEWDPTQGDVARQGIARRSLMQDFYYCIAAAPEVGYQPGKLYSATAMGKDITFWQGTAVVSIVKIICSALHHVGITLS